MWSHRRLLFVRQTGSSLPILEVCRFRFRQFSGSGDHSFQHISTKSHVQINSAMPTLYSMVNETKNRNRILEMCKFHFRFRLVHCGTITSVAHQILHADRKCYRFKFCTLLGCGQLDACCCFCEKPEPDFRF